MYGCLKDYVYLCHTKTEFAMKGPKYLSILHDTSSKNAMWACKMIPVLIYWATVSKSPHTYGELSKAVGHHTDQIGRVLGLIDDVFNALKKARPEFKDMPTLNCLVISKTTKLPSNGFDYVSHDYSSLTEEQKADQMKRLNSEAYYYDRWDNVLDALELTPYKGSDNKAYEVSIRKGTFSKHGSEGVKHKALKEYIYNHPECIGIKNVKHKEMEHILLSGDRLDVYFQLKDDTQIAVEVKSSISDNADILRGVYQCVKYEAILNAEQSVKGIHRQVKALLVLEGEMPISVASDAVALHVTFMENVTISDN